MLRLGSAEPADGNVDGPLSLFSGHFGRLSLQSGPRHLKVLLSFGDVDFAGEIGAVGEHRRPLAVHLKEPATEGDELALSVGEFVFEKPSLERGDERHVVRERSEVPFLARSNDRNDLQLNDASVGRDDGKMKRLWHLSSNYTAVRRELRLK